MNDIIDAIEDSKGTIGNFINEVGQSYKLSEELEETNHFTWQNKLFSS